MHFNLRKKIFLLGSSMTERSFCLEHHGWGASMAHWYARSADVLNRGAGGYNSRWLNAYLPRLLADDKPDLVVLFIGNNDAIDEHEPQHVPLSEYKANVISILEQLYHAKPSVAVLLVTTTRVNQDMKPLQKNARRHQYAEVLRFIHRNRMRPEVLGTENIPQDIALVDLWGGEGVNDAPLAEELEMYSIVESDLHDGSHLNTTGNKKVFCAMRDSINKLFPQLSPDSVKIRPVRAKRTSNGEHNSESFEVANGHYLSGISVKKKPLLAPCGVNDKAQVHYNKGTVGISSNGGAASDFSEHAPQCSNNNSRREIHTSHNNVNHHTSGVSKENSMSNKQEQHTNTSTSTSTIANNTNASHTHTNTRKPTVLVRPLPAPYVDHNGEPALQWTVPRWRNII